MRELFMGTTLLLVVLCATVVTVLSFTPPGIFHDLQNPISCVLAQMHNLSPGVTLPNLQLKHNEAEYFSLHGLQPETQYEVRVSYPSSVRPCVSGCLFDGI